MEAQQQFHHFSHEHPLKLTEMKQDDKNLCSACQKHCSGQTYVCIKSNCKLILHESCFKLPLKIRHPFHPQHPLTLEFRNEGAIQLECKVCYRFCSGFTYSCKHCRFDVDVDCPVVISTIKYQGHHHNIVFVDGLDPCQTDASDVDSFRTRKRSLFCSACGKLCGYSTAMFHCVQCSFNLHLQCGPLPCFLKHEDHPCSLELTESPVIVKGEDKDTDVFYCDACDKERDPRLPVYYCSNGCAYLVEIKCMISQILLSLRGDNGEVEVRSAVFKNKTGKVICRGTEIAWQDSVAESDTNVGELEPYAIYEEIIETRRQMGIKKKKMLIEEIEEEIESVCALKNEQGGHDSDLTSTKGFGFSDEGCITFMSLMDHTNTSSYLYEELMSVDPENNSVILEDLCAKYGDIIPKSTTASSVFVSMLCETVRGMCTTRVADLAEAELFLWQRCLKSLQREGFKVEFALNRLKRVAHAYYALKVDRTAKEDAEQMDKEIEEVSHQIKELEVKLMELERSKSRTPQKPTSSGILAECFKEASVLKWMVVGDGLL